MRVKAAKTKSNIFWRLLFMPLFIFLKVRVYRRLYKHGKRAFPGTLLRDAHLGLLDEFF